MATKASYPRHTGNINATPSAVSPAGSSITSPGGGYPKNPAQAPNQSEDVGRGIPQSPDYYALGISVSVMQPCYVCGRAYPPAPTGTLPSIGQHMQEHNESPYFDEGSNGFGDRNVEV